MEKKTVNSLSGGKTSSYMATHYPADYDIFALVRINDHRASPKDPWLARAVSDKINADFIATAEDDKTLVLMLELEQKIGREITWVTGPTFDEVISSKKALPNRRWRFCTSEMKIQPIFNWWRQNIGEVVDMRIGYRYDESERADRFTDTNKVVIGKSKSGKRNKWGLVKWRNGLFPLIEDKILHYHVKQWSLKSGLVFPEDSNCVGCFWKDVQQLRRNWHDNRDKMQWFSDQEASTGRRFKKEMKYSSVKKLMIQQDFDFGTGSGCMAGACHD